MLFQGSHFIVINSIVGSGCTYPNNSHPSQNSPEVSTVLCSWYTVLIHHRYQTAIFAQTVVLLMDDLSRFARLMHKFVQTTVSLWYIGILRNLIIGKGTMENVYMYYLKQKYPSSPRIWLLSLSISKCTVAKPLKESLKLKN
jgi:hypothetical protein